MLLQAAGWQEKQNTERELTHKHKYHEEGLLSTSYHQSFQLLPPHQNGTISRKDQ